jgi:hypothetical protein
MSEKPECEFSIDPNSNLCIFLRLRYTAKRCSLPKGPLTCPTEGQSSIFPVKPKPKEFFSNGSLIDIGSIAVDYVASLGSNNKILMEAKLNQLINKVVQLKEGT